jgi:hypothetical protein
VYADAAAVAVVDLATGRAVGALSVYATEPCPWSAIDVAAVGADAGVVAELLQASMALGAGDAEAAGRADAGADRPVWVEQAKGALVATEGLDPAAASQRLRGRAGASQRTVADVAREVMQDAQREWTAVLAAERARSRAAEARAEHAEAALEAAQAEASKKDGGADGPPASPNDRQR